MKKFILLLLLAFISSLCLSEEKKFDLQTIIAPFNDDKSRFKAFPSSQNLSENLHLILAEVKNLKSEEGPWRLTYAVFNEEKKGLWDSDRRESTNIILLEESIKLIEAEHPKTYYARKLASDEILKLYRPEVLDVYRTRLEDCIKKRFICNIFILYSSLPSADVDFINKYVGNKDSVEGELDEITVGAIKTKCGNADARKKLIESIKKIDHDSYRGLVDIADTLAICRNDMELKKFLAEGLRSEDMITAPGGGANPRRNFYAEILAAMMRFDSSFPELSGLIEDEDLDKVEKWCNEKLGVKYPTTPRKKLEIIPRVEFTNPSSNDNPDKTSNQNSNDAVPRK